MRRSTIIAASIAVASLALTGCGSDASSGDGASAGKSKCDTEFDAGKATFTKPPADPSPAAKDKKIGIVAVGMSSPTVAVGAAGVQAAAKDIGWDATLYDAKLNPSDFPKMVRDAITAGSDAIIGVGLDAPLVKSALEEAKAKGIETISVQGWDLDQDPGTAGAPPVFTSRISFGDRYPDFVDAERARGADSASYLIHKAGCSGKILNFSNNEYTTLKLLNEGFLAQTEKECPDCKVVDVPWLAKEFGPALQAKGKAAFLKNPDVKAVHGATNPQLGITQAVVQSQLQDKVTVLGGFGLGLDFDVVTENKGLNAVASWPVEWWAYAAVDTINSKFNKTEPRDEGLGYQVIDKEVGLPPTGQDFKPEFDVPAAYKASWGASN